MPIFVDILTSARISNTMNI